MNRVAELIKLINKELDDLKVYFLESPMEIFRKYVAGVDEAMCLDDSTRLLKYENYMIFWISFYFFNQNIISFDESKKVVNEIKDIINGWTYDKDYELLGKLFECFDDDGMIINTDAYNYMTELKLPTDFASYYMKYVYLCMRHFLGLKNVLKQIDSSNEKRKIKAKKIKKLYHECLFRKIITIILENVDKAVKNDKNDRNLAKKKDKYTRELQSQLFDFSVLELTAIPENWLRYLNLEILEKLYFIVFDNLDKKENELNLETAQKEQMINRTPLTRYLYEQGILIDSIDKYVVNAIEELSLRENIEVLFRFLNNLGLSLNQILTKYSDVLINLTEDKVKMLAFLINSKVISKDTLLNNLDLIGIRYNELLINYEILKPIMEFDNPFYDDSILLKSPNMIKNMLSVLGQYSFSKYNYIYLLCHYEYLNIYDLLLENDIPVYLFISICETENPLMTIKRILVYREIGEEFETSNKLLRKNVASEDKSFMSNDEIDDYLFLFDNLVSLNGDRITSVLQSDVVSRLDTDYNIVNNCYVIGKTRISRPKFLRNFEAQKENKESILACLVSDSLLTEDEHLEIVKMIKEKRL